MATGVGGDVIGAFALTIFLVLVAVIVGDFTMSLAVGALVIVLAIYMMSKVPIRTSLMVLGFCALTLENPAELPAAGLYKTPFFMVGAAMLNHLNNPTGFSWMSFSGMDIALVSLLIISWYRRSRGSKIDSAGRTPTPVPLVKLAYLSLAGTAYVELSGLLRGGNFSMSLWQIDKVMYLPIIFLLWQQGLRGSKDLPGLARVLLAAATVRACLAIYVSRTVVMPNDPKGEGILPYATSHHDSILFAAAATLLMALVIQRAGRWAPKLAIVLLPILIGGMLANNRRMVWVQIGIVFITLFFVTPPNATKRKLKKIAWALSPLVALYIMVGWNSPTGVFKPVATIRSVVEPATDASSMTREIENYNLMYTLKQYPILGTGYGNGYWEIVPLPPMGYPLERYCPHNSLLGLWVYSGLIGYTMMTLLWAAGVFFGMRALSAAKAPIDRAAALLGFGTVLIYLVQCWGDIGLGSWTGVFITSAGIAVAGKLAVATGAWSAERAPSRSEPKRSVPPQAVPAGTASWQQSAK
jgi:hypothetical protein